MACSSEIVICSLYRDGTASLLKSALLDCVLAIWPVLVHPAELLCLNLSEFSGSTALQLTVNYLIKYIASCGPVQNTQQVYSYIIINVVELG